MFNYENTPTPTEIPKSDALWDVLDDKLIGIEDEATQKQIIDTFVKEKHAETESALTY